MFRLPFTRKQGQGHTQVPPEPRCGEHGRVHPDGEQPASWPQHCVINGNAVFPLSSLARDKSGRGNKAYLVEYPAYVVVRDGEDTTSTLAELVQKCQYMYGVIEPPRQTTKQDQVIRGLRARRTQTYPYF